MFVANPIYDVVFKFLMEDERVARTILSALLKKRVKKVEVRPHEYSNISRDTLSVFRIDFAATIVDDNGEEQLTLIELQKTWKPTEILRFRQYLGLHYSNPKNILEDNRALPMVAVYILGHKVGNIEEPVFYVGQTVRNYDGEEVRKGLPNPFVDSLTHDSIIVQIPRLHGQINSRLDMVLSIFDQTRCSKEDEHILQLNDEDYPDDDNDMGRVLFRLSQAASNAEMRHKMNVEDEYFFLLEKGETELLIKEKQLAEKDAQLTEMDAQLTEMDAQLTEMDAQLTEKNAQIERQRQTIAQAAKAMHRFGATVQDIAHNLGISEEEAEHLIIYL